MIRLTASLALGLVLALAACGGRDDAETPETTVADSAAPNAGRPGMAGMAATDTGVAAQMEAHMRAMESASADSLTALLPGHRQRVANMIARMNQEMRDMNMPADAEWTATVDSLRQDLRQMPEMDATELKTLMPAHHARVTRLSQLHDSMMAAMGM